MFSINFFNEKNCSQRPPKNINTPERGTHSLGPFTPEPVGHHQRKELGLWSQRWGIVPCAANTHCVTFSVLHCVFEPQLLPLKKLIIIVLVSVVKTKWNNIGKMICPVLRGGKYSTRISWLLSSLCYYHYYDHNDIIIIMLLSSSLPLPTAHAHRSPGWNALQMLIATVYGGPIMY